MSYTVKLRDKQVYSLNDASGFDLKTALLNASGVMNVSLNDDMVRSSEIVSVTKDAYTEVDMPVNISHYLPTGCTGTYSIQREINRIASSESNWPELIQDKVWREATRQQLRSSISEWCDYRANQCSCHLYQKSQTNIKASRG